MTVALVVSAETAANVSLSVWPSGSLNHPVGATRSPSRPTVTVWSGIGFGTVGGWFTPVTVTSNSVLTVWSLESLAVTVTVTVPVVASMPNSVSVGSTSDTVTLVVSSDVAVRVMSLPPSLNTLFSATSVVPPATTVWSGIGFATIGGSSFGVAFASAGGPHPLALRARTWKS